MKQTNRMLLAFAMLFSCEEEEIVTVGSAPPVQAPDVKVAPIEIPKAKDLNEDEFVEADTNRDPFRGFAILFQPKPTREVVQRDVVMSRSSVDEMRVVAIVSGISDARAMIVDGTGVGYTVKRGDYIGRPDIVRAGGSGGVPFTVNWRIDRIRGADKGRSAEVILTRENPLAPNETPITRVLPLLDRASASIDP